MERIQDLEPDGAFPEDNKVPAKLPLEGIFQVYDSLHLGDTGFSGFLTCSGAFQATQGLVSDGIGENHEPRMATTFQERPPNLIMDAEAAQPRGDCPCLRYLCSCSEVVVEKLSIHCAYGSWRKSLSLGGRCFL